MPSGSAMVVEEDEEEEALMEGKCEVLGGSLGAVKREVRDEKTEKDEIGDETVRTAFDGVDDDLDLKVEEDSRFILAVRAMDGSLSLSLFLGDRGS